MKLSHLRLGLQPDVLPVATCPYGRFDLIEQFNQLLNDLLLDSRFDCRIIQNRCGNLLLNLSIEFEGRLFTGCPTDIDLDVSV